MSLARCVCKRRIALSFLGMLASSMSSSMNFSVSRRPPEARGITGETALGKEAGRGRMCIRVCVDLDVGVYVCNEK